jgi:hypothetical protein
MSDAMLAFTNAKPGYEAQFNKWYGQSDLPAVIGVDGVLGGSRLEAAQVLSDAGHRRGAPQGRLGRSPSVQFDLEPDGGAEVRPTVARSSRNTGSRSGARATSGLKSPQTAGTLTQLPKSGSARHRGQKRKSA